MDVLQALLKKWPTVPAAAQERMNDLQAQVVQQSQELRQAREHVARLNEQRGLSEEYARLLEVRSLFALN